MSDCKKEVLRLAQQGGWSVERSWGWLIVLHCPVGKVLRNYRGEAETKRVLCQDWREALKVIRETKLENRS